MLFEKDKSLIWDLDFFIWRTKGFETDDIWRFFSFQASMNLWVYNMCFAGILQELVFLK